jgi:UDP-N-acetyl-D-mannosaminuronic acid dehydrogenase
MGSGAVYDVAVVGLGYVGLTLATVLADAGHWVVGIEKRPELVRLTNRGVPHFAEAGLADALSRVVGSGQLVAAERFDDILTCSNYIITVGTPLSAEGEARLDMIESATREVASNMQDGALVVLRSTVKIDTTRRVVRPILAATGKKFALAMCPERTLEGRALQELRQLPQIIGADDLEAADRAEALFSRITNATVKVATPETAEMIKLIDNTYRDDRFAFANEVARLCDAFGVNVHEVISAGKLGFPRTDVASPGLVGGPCLEKDPHILIESARTRGLNLEIAAAGRLVNERQPNETVKFIAGEISRRNLSNPLRIRVLGMAFKGIPATEDLRGSMSVKVLESLRKALPGAQFGLFDPVIAPDQLAKEFPDDEICPTFNAAVSGASVVIIANNHSDLGRSAPRTLRQLISPDGFVFDYWGHFSHLSAADVGESYFCVGCTHPRD